MKIETSKDDESNKVMGMKVRLGTMRMTIHQYQIDCCDRETKTIQTWKIHNSKTISITRDGDKSQRAQC